MIDLKNEPNVTPGQSPNVTPKQVDFAVDREAGYIFTAVNSLSKQHGQFSESLGQNTKSIDELRRCVDGVNSQIADLRSFCKGVVWCAGGIAIVIGLLWEPVIKHGLAHAISEQVKPEITKQVEESRKSLLPAAPVKTK